MCALKRSWQKFDELQKGWAAQEQALEEEVGRYKADALFANSIKEENIELKNELEAARKKASDLSKEAKETKEELRTCHMDRDYHVEVANKKSAINDDL